MAAIVSVAVLWLGYSYVQFLRDEDLHCDTITINGLIGSETFVNLRGCLTRSMAAKKTFLVQHSGGGDAAAALALGTLVHRYHWDVEVVDVCASSCANYIFPAGNTKYLHERSLLLFHGGPYQANFMEMAEKLDQGLAKDGTPANSVTLGQANKEGTISFTPNKSIADQEVLEFLSMADVSTAVEKVTRLRTASDRFYQELGVNPLLSTYGQMGTYEPTYTSYEHGGFTYRLDSLRRLGLGHIELKDGEWRPERNPAYPDVYEVTFP